MTSSTTCCRRIGATPTGPPPMAEPRVRLDQPQVPRRSLRPRFDTEAFGKWTEKFARFLGTGRFLIIMTAVIVAWVLFNVIPGFPHPDKYPFQIGRASCRERLYTDEVYEG